MAFNKYMHPKNPYRNKKPDFKELAIKYEEFRSHSTQDTAGKVHIDFKDPECLRALSWALLKDDFDLDLEMPLERLIPTIPLRLNYILWIKDIVGDAVDVTGIDIGCGASCVYSLLGSKLYGWKMLTSDIDGLNIAYAKKNVVKNQMEDKIRVLQVDEGSGLKQLLERNDGNFYFTMCNPPFFENNLEAYGMTSRKPDRAEPKSMSTASEHESIVEGGEVAYVKQMIADSILLQKRVRVYSTMLGKKKSLGVLKNELQSKKIHNFSTTRFCQGHTMRWGLAWSFDESVKFPPDPFSSYKKSQPQKPLTFKVEPSKIDCTVDCIGKEVKKVLEQCKIEHTVVMCSSIVWSVSATAYENTWSHSRRKRREEARKVAEQSKKAKIDTSEDDTMDVEDSVEIKEKTSGDSSVFVESNDCKTKQDSEVDIVEICGAISEPNKDNLKDTSVAEGGAADACDKGMDICRNDDCTSSDKQSGDSKSSTCSKGKSRMKLDEEKIVPFRDMCSKGRNSEKTEGSYTEKTEGGDTDGSKDVPKASTSGKIDGTGTKATNVLNKIKLNWKDKKDTEPLFKCWVSVRKEKEGIMFEAKWMRGSSKESLHQIFQHFKNHFR